MIPHKDPDIRRIQYDKLLQELETDFKEESPQFIASLIEKIKVLEEFALDKKRFFCLFDNKTFRPIYLSDNIATESGYTLKEYYNRGPMMIFRHIHWKQLTLFYKLYLWGRRFRAFTGKGVPYTNTTAFLSGMKFKDKWGKWRTFFIKQKMLSLIKNNKVSLSFLEMEEITALYKADFVWSRIINTTDETFYRRVYFSSGSKKEYADLLSERELEILQLIVQKKNSKEISEALSISPNTVSRHRKNMIAKVGVTDMTALIYLCRLCQII